MAQGGYGNFWDAFTMECMEVIKASGASPEQRCKLQAVQRVQQNEPTWQPQEVQVRVEVQNMGGIFHSVENMFSFILLVLVPMLLCVACLLFVVKSERGNRVLYNLAGRAQRARIIGVGGGSQRYARVMPQEEDAFLKAEEEEEAYEMEGNF